MGSLRRVPVCVTLFIGTLPEGKPPKERSIAPAATGRVTRHEPRRKENEPGSARLPGPKSTGRACITRVRGRTNPYPKFNELADNFVDLSGISRNASP